MRVVIQRVSEAQVRVDGAVLGKIDQGYVVLLAVEKEDTDEDLAYIAKKIDGLRVFEDEEGKMNLNLAAVKGEILLISQFTLYGDMRKGNRPSFSRSAAHEQAEEAYLAMKAKLEAMGHTVETGQFAAHMDVELTNSGPVTILVDSRKEF